MARRSGRQAPVHSVIVGVGRPAQNGGRIVVAGDKRVHTALLEMLQRERASRFAGAGAHTN